MRISADSGYITLFGLELSLKDINETTSFIFSEIEKGALVVREDVNAFKVCLKADNDSVHKALQEASIINIDGMSVVFAARLICGLKAPRVTGCDLLSRLIDEAAQRNKKIYLLGAAEDVVSSLVRNLSAAYSNDLVAGYRNGYFDRSEWQNIVKEIDASGADLLFVGTPSPQKEEFVSFAKQAICRPMALMGVGGSFDVLAGKVKRAPIWVQNWGLEWFYRFLQEPGRMWKRYLVTNTKFFLLTMREFFERSSN